MTKLTAS